jgi:hypothetical protein
MMKLLRRNAAFIYFSFLVTGLTSVAPQRLFAVAAPQTAQAWVAGTLLAGTLASIAAVALADRHGLSRRPALAASVLIFAMTGALLGSFGVKALLAAAALQVIARFMANYAKQDLDHRGVTVAGSDNRVSNDRVAVMMRFIGMVLGPLWFGAFQFSSPAMLAALFIMVLLSLASVSGLTQAPMADPEPVHRMAALKLEERLLVGVAIGIYAGYYLLASNIVYVLGAIHEEKHASAVAGVLITTVYATAMVATIISLRWKSQHLGLLWMLPAPVLMFGCGIALNSSLADERVITVGAAVALGFAFALYMLAVRNHVTSEMGTGNLRWLAFFNNLANTSALVGFSIMSVLVAASRLLAFSYATLLAFGLCALALITILGAAIYKWLARGRRGEINSCFW